ncbi:unnamed protein product [Oppiella nova]|uniref:Fatty acid synthase n=1 Tax=Oppiella nova TaxID=334625 RepID=A0A7R9LWH6_9ACAR|nr:unnamed protein product [Oppiella nova]CAG2167697.1 unnamed protein product [Oppiella nova]
MYASDKETCPNKHQDMSTNDVVISGMSGRFPLSDTTDEFARNLFDGIDMVTADDSRWPPDLLDMNPRMGRLVNYGLFDSTFFGVMEQMVEGFDPMARMLLEVTYEAIVDAEDANPQSLRGSQTGVYVAVSMYPMTDGYPEYLQPDIRKSLQSQFLTLYNLKTFYSSRISFVFDFKGPSMIVDTACSGSGTAFCLAMNDMKLGHIDQAVICGAHMTLEPFQLQVGQELGILSSRGISAVLDQDADGFVKGETVCALLLQHSANARRLLATVRSSRMNIDGYKTIGMFFPSAEAQEELMVKTYKEANIDPLTLTYIEGHVTGTKCTGKTELLVVGVGQ